MLQSIFLLPVREGVSADDDTRGSAAKLVAHADLGNDIFPAGFEHSQLQRVFCVVTPRPFSLSLYVPAPTVRQPLRQVEGGETEDTC